MTIVPLTTLFDFGDTHFYNDLCYEYEGVLPQDDEASNAPVLENVDGHQHHASAPLQSPARDQLSFSKYCFNYYVHVVYEGASECFGDDFYEDEFVASVSLTVLENLST